MNRAEEAGAAHWETPIATAGCAKRDEKLFLCARCGTRDRSGVCRHRAVSSMTRCESGPRFHLSLCQSTRCFLNKLPELAGSHLSGCSTKCGPDPRNFFLRARSLAKFAFFVQRTHTHTTCTWKAEECACTSARYSEAQDGFCIWLSFTLSWLCASLFLHVFVQHTWKDWKNCVASLSPFFVPNSKSELRFKGLAASKMQNYNAIFSLSLFAVWVKIKFFESSTLCCISAVMFSFSLPFSLCSHWVNYSTLSQLLGTMTAGK